MWDDYFNVNEPMRDVVRYAALAAPVVGLLFAFSVSSAARLLASSIWARRGMS
jgi:hypothetical protein